MAVEPLLRLMPPAANSPKEPKCYGSPAKFPAAKKECMKVERVPSIERLMNQAAEELDAVRAGAGSPEADGEEEEVDLSSGGASVYTDKKSMFWSKEVDEKLNLGGADPYGMLELEDKRYKATADEIRKAYRRLVLTHHPDKKAGEEAAAKKPEKNKKEGEAEGEDGEAEGEEDDADAEFKLLGAAYELLGNVETRRQYDSIDNFNDYLPTAFSKKSGRTFYQAFRGGFSRQAKFSSKTPVPQLGDEDTPYEQVAKFYKFWFEFSSWRDFSLLSEHDLKEAEDREEKRWMMRQNKNQTDRIKKDEGKRLFAFVQLAHDNDPRVLAEKARLAAAKQAVKDAKEAAIRAKEMEKEAAAKAIEDAKKAKEAEEAEAKAAAKAAGADAKREKERQRSALKKARKDFKALGEGAWAERAADLDVIAAAVGAAEKLTELAAAMAAGPADADAAAAMSAALEEALKQ